MNAIMMDKIDEICIQAGIPRFREKNEIIKILNEFVDSMRRNEVYILWPHNTSSQILYDISQGKFVLEIDKEKDYKVINRSFKRKYKYLINTSYKSKLKRKLRNLCLSCLNRCKVIDIYEFLDKRGVHQKRDLVYEFRMSYLDILEDLKLYQNENKLEDKKNAGIKILIADYLVIRDFKNAFQYIDKLEACQDKESQKYIDVRNRIEDYLAEIKKRIDGQEHIVVNWIDGILFKDMGNMPFLKEQAGKGICFENMYNSTAFTNPVMRSIFTGKLYIEDKLYKMKIDDFEDSELYKIIVKNGYQFMYAGSSSKGGIFSNDKMEFINKLYVYYEYIPSTLIQFELISLLARQKKPCFIIAHNIAETHTPYINPVNKRVRIITEHEVLMKSLVNDNKDIKKQMIASQKYLDEQLRYYSKFYSKTLYNIYMSDHGNLDNEEKPICLRDIHHTIFFILGKNIVPKKSIQITSLLVFSKLVKNLLEKNSDITEVYDKDYALIQQDDMYNSGHVQDFLEAPEVYRTVYIQHRGIITEKDYYVRYITGEEYYVINGCDENLIECKQYVERIAYLKKLVGNQFIDIRKEKKYANSLTLYKKLGYEIDKDIEFVK